MQKLRERVGELMGLIRISERAAVTNDNLRLLWTNDIELAKGRIECDRTGVYVLSIKGRRIPLRHISISIDEDKCFIFTIMERYDLRSIFKGHTYDDMYSAYCGRLRLCTAKYLALTRNAELCSDPHALSNEIKRCNLHLLSRFINIEMLSKLFSSLWECDYIELKTYLEYYLDAVSDICRRNGFEFSSHVERELFVKTDPVLLRCAISNLLVNSKMYNRSEKPSARLEIYYSEGVVKLIFYDNGGGINDEQLNGSRTPFVSQNNGEGLGLFFVREYARHLGGSLDLINKNGGLYAELSLGKPQSVSDIHLASLPIIPYPTLLENEYVILAKGFDLIGDTL